MAGWQDGRIQRGIMKSVFFNALQRECEEVCMPLHDCPPARIRHSNASFSRHPNSEVSPCL